MQMQQHVWLVMGVSGSGKTSVARDLAQATGGQWLDADDFHPRRNVERMARGQPLSDEDRWPWLAAVAEAAARAVTAAAGPVFVACSALKRPYRQLLRERLPGLQTLYLQGEETLIHSRMLVREHHYMGAGMLRSQFQDLEPPLGEPGVTVLDIRPARAEVVAAALQHVQQARQMR